jgi:hypothetical protein
MLPDSKQTVSNLISVFVTESTKNCQIELTPGTINCLLHTKQILPWFQLQDKPIFTGF